MAAISRFLFRFTTLAGFYMSTLFAQIPPVKVDSLRPPQGAQETAACSAAETSSCAEAAAKLLPLILGDSPMIENLRRLDR